MKTLLRLVSLLALSSAAIAGNYTGDYAPGDTVDCNFGTVRPSTGASFTLAGTPAISVYKDNGTTESTTGVTLTADFDSRTGLNHFRVTTASDGTFYSAGSFFEAVITTGTVDSISVVGQPVCSFTLGKVSALRPTTAARTLAVSAAGAADANVTQFGGSNGTFASGRPETNLTHIAGSAVSTSTAQLGINVVNFGGSAGTFSSGRPEVNATHVAGSSLATLTGAYPSLGIIDSGTAQAATGTTLQLRSAASFDANDEIVGATCVITTATTGAGQARTITAYTNATDTATVATWTTTPTGTITYACFGTAASSGSAPSAATVAAAVWDEALSGHTTGGTSGERLGRVPNAVAGASGGILIAGTNADFDVTANASFAGGVSITQSTSNTAALVVTGNGTGNGATFTSGSGATGNGITAAAASTNGSGLSGTGTGTGSGVLGVGAVASVTGNVAGNVTGSVGSMASGGIADASFATTAGPFRALGIVDQGTAQAATSTTLQLRSAATFANTELVGNTILITGATTGVGQSRLITAYVGATDTATVATWDTTPTGTITYTVNSTTAAAAGGGLDAAATRAALGLAAANLDTQLSGIQSDTDNLQTRVPTSLVSGRIDASVGAYQSGLTPLQPTTAGRTLDVSTGGEAGVDWANIGSPTTSVGLSGTTISTTQQVASVSGSIGSVAAGGITAASFATDAITAAKIATDVGAEIAAAVGTRQLPDNYSLDGDQPTTDQALLSLLQIMTEATLSGNQILVKKPDGTTTAITITLAPSAANPISRTRTQ